MNIKKHSTTAILLLSLNTMLSSYSIEQENTKLQKIICVDFDNVLTKTFSISLSTIMKLLPCILRHPLAIAYVLKDLPAIIHKGEEIAKCHKTLKQTIIEMLHYLKDNNYGNFFDFKKTILDIGMSPGPIDDVIQLIRELKAQGHILIGATNQDYAANYIYRKKLRKQGINLDELFDAILTCYSPENEVINSDRYQNPHVFMANQGVRKPNKQYFQKLKELKPICEFCEFYLIDDAEENVEGAKKAGFHGIHFKLPRNLTTGRRCNAREISNQDLHRAAEQLRNQLKKEGLLN
jgi:HAD superfamily hydrolase (TIGR01509 family)